MFNSKKAKYFILVGMLLIVAGVFIFQNSSQNLPEKQQIDKLFKPNSSYEFISYDVKDEIPYVTFNDKRNNRQCRANLVKDYKVGFFIGNWIFGMDWSCNK